MIHNVHTREIAAPADRVAAGMVTLGGPEDRWWPAPAWDPMVLDRPLSVGAAGGHGSIRYHVTAYEPGRRIRFAFDPTCGLSGHHELSVMPSGSSVIIRHELHASVSGTLCLGQPLLVRIHDAVIEDLFDNAEHEATGAVRRRARGSRTVSMLQRLGLPRADPVPVPTAARLAQQVIAREGSSERADLIDAYEVPHHPRLPADPQDWADAVFRRPPRWVVAMLGLRQALVGLVGIERGDAESFATRARTDDEVLLGSDAGHLGFRASVLVAPGSVTLSTVARAKNCRGRVYLCAVRVLHPLIVRAMLTRAHREFVTGRHDGAEVGRQDEARRQYSGAHG
ncbi:hypothetical protein GCM10027061_25290 [Nesterenkonia suensis]